MVNRYTACGTFAVGGPVSKESVRRKRRYIQTFESGFDEGLRDVQLSFMQSDGGLTPVSRFSGHKAILSGPAGGCDHWAPSCRAFVQPTQAEHQ